MSLFATIDRFKVSSWLNKERWEPEFGIKVRIPGHGWCHFARDGKALLFKTENEARDEIKKLRADVKQERIKREKE